MRWSGWLTYPQIATLLVLAGLVFGLPWPARAEAVERTIHIEARDFAFRPSRIAVNPGDRLTIELASGDFVHGLHVEGYDVNLTADPGQPASVTFIADRPGTFRIRCSVPCGALHPFMGARLQVGVPVGFWRALLLGVLAIVAGGLTFGRKADLGGGGGA